MDDGALAAVLFGLLTAVVNCVVTVLKLMESGSHNREFADLTGILKKHIGSTGYLIRDHSARFRKAQEQMDRLIELVSEITHKK